MRTFLVLSLIAPAMAVAGCANNNTTTGALSGAALGAAAGAIAGNNLGDGDAETGALIGAAVGAVGGAVAGCARDGGCGAQGRGAAPQGQQVQWIYDSTAERYYYVDPRTGDTFWEDGSLRTRAQPF